MHKLYWDPTSGAFAVQAVLEELGLPYERVVVDTKRGQHRAPDFLTLNPMAQVPVLELPDGTVLTESAAMVVHLCDARPEAGLLPPPGTPERALAYRWLFWLAVEHYGAALRWYYPGRYTSDPNGIEGVKSAALARMNRLFDLAEESIGLGPWVLGERMCAADFYLFMLLLWHPDRQPVLDRWPKLGAHARRLWERPAIRRIWAQHYPEGGGHPWSTWTSSSAP